jgi:hypothetical protein
MMNFFASLFAGLGMMISSLFGGHQSPPQNQAVSSTTPRQHMATSTSAGRMGAPATKHVSPAISGKIVSISGTSLIVTGHVIMIVSGRTVDVATSTYAVDASNARLIKFAKGSASSTPITISNISKGDSVTILGTINANAVIAKTIIEGVIPVRKMTPSSTPAAKSK